MIKDGIKKEEYREVKPFYNSRLYKHLGQTIKIRFRNGYNKTSPTIECECFITNGIGGNLQWGAEKDKSYYILHIKKVKQITSRQNVAKLERS